MNRLLRSTELTGTHESKVGQKVLIVLSTSTQHIVLINYVYHRSDANNTTGGNRLNGAGNAVHSVLSK